MNTNQEDKEEKGCCCKKGCRCCEALCEALRKVCQVLAKACEKCCGKKK